MRRGGQVREKRLRNLPRASGKKLPIKYAQIEPPTRLRPGQPGNPGAWVGALPGRPGRDAPFKEATMCGNCGCGGGKKKPKNKPKKK